MKSNYLVVFCVALVFIFYNMQDYQHEETMLEQRAQPFDSAAELNIDNAKMSYLPHGILQPHSDLEMKSLSRTSQYQEINTGRQLLLAMPVGINQKRHVDSIISKFLSENFTVMLFHYDGNVDDWNDLYWSKNVIHISSLNNAKWWFAKRFLHPDILSIYDYIFIWDEDLRVENFDPVRYVNIIKSEGIEVSQPVLNPESPEVYQQITICRDNGLSQRRIYDKQESVNCYIAEGPPCTGCRWVEGRALVFSRSAWQCAWHLIQNGLESDIKFGYCVQKNRKKQVRWSFKSVF